MIDSAKYKRIAASVAEVGLVEPLVVAQVRSGNSYPLLDGHVRLSILKEQGSETARCVVSSDDEAFTYNKRVNRLATIQEHYMIVRAIERGVSEEKLARALNVDIGAIRQRRQLLNGINAEVAELLKDKPVGIQTFQKLRKMKPIRQLEVAELMVSANNYSASYARALLVTTKPADLVNPEKKTVPGLSPEQIEKLQRELDAGSQDYHELEASFGDDTLVLVIAAGFLERLLSRPAIEAYLANAQAPYLALALTALAALDLKEEGEAILSPLFNSYVECKARIAATSIEPSRIFAYMLARLTDSFAEVQGQVAQPNELGTVYLLAAPLFDLTDVFDEAMSELDHVTINAFVADDHSLFALETIDDGENNPFTIGHYIWRIDDLLQHFPPHAFVQPTDPSVAGGAILASLIFPDRVPWFVFRALDQLKVLSG